MVRNALVSAALGLALGAVGATAGHAQSATKLVIGAHMPMTGSLARSGHAFDEGMRVALEACNAAQPRYRFEVEEIDDESTPAKAVSAVEKLAALNLATAKSLFEDTTEQVKALAVAKDPQELVKLNSSFAQPAVEKAVTYGKSVYDIAVQTQASFTKVAEANVAELNKAFVTLLDTAAKNSPAGSDAAVTAMKSALAAVNSAYDSIQKVAKQAAEVVEVNFAAAQNKPRRKVA